MQTISTAMSDYFVQDAQIIKPKVSLTLLDSSDLKNISITATSTFNQQYSVENLLNGDKEQTFAYAITDTLDRNGEMIFANGSVVCSPPDDYDYEAEVGWMSSAQSDSSGEFVDNQSIDIQFDQTYVNKVFVSTSYSLGRAKEFNLYFNFGGLWEQFGQSYDFDDSSVREIDLRNLFYSFENQTTDFLVSKPYDQLFIYHYSILANSTSTIKIYNADDAVTNTPLFELDLAANESASLNIPNITTSNGIYVEVSGDVTGSIGYGYHYINPVGALVEVLNTENPNDFARLHEIDLLYEVDISNDVISMDISKIREEMDTTVPVGITAANSIQISLDNTDKKYNKDNTGSIGKFAKVDQKLVISFYVDDDGVSDVIRQGTFYVDTWQYDSGGMVVDISARDFSKFLQEFEIEDGVVISFVEGGEAMEYLAKYGGVPARKINAAKSYRRTIRYQAPQHYFPMSETTLNPGVDEATYVDLMTEDVASDVNGHPVLLYEPSMVASEASEYFAPKFYGTTNTRFEFADRASLNSSNAWSITCVVKIETLPDVGDRYQIVSKWDNSTGSAVNYSLGILDDGRVRASLTYASGGGVVDFDTPVGEVEINNIYHISARFDGPNQRLYINVNGNKYEFITAENQCATNTAPFAIGGFNFNWVTYKHEFEGLLAHISFYDRCISDQEVFDQYYATFKGYKYIFNFMHSIDETVWSAMTLWSMADLGSFYFDEYENYIYEYRNAFYEPILTQHSQSQISIADGTYIVSGSYVVEVQATKITVNIYPQSYINSGLQSIWSANGDKVLGITNLGASLGSATTNSVLVGDLRVTLSDGTKVVAWPSEGYIKIDDEIIKYTGRTANTFTGLERGQFGTTPASHTSGAEVREARYFFVEYSNAPAISVREPFFTANEFEGYVDVDYFLASPYSAEFVVSVAQGTQAQAGDFIILSGTNPETDDVNLTSLVGVPLIEESGEEQVLEEVRTANNRRKGSKKEIVIDNKFIQSEEMGKMIADFLLLHFAQPVPILDVEIMGLPHLQLGDRITISYFDQLDIVNKDYWILSSNISYDGGIKQSLQLRQVDGN